MMVKISRLYVTDFVPQFMHQNLATIYSICDYGRISFAVSVQTVKISTTDDPNFDLRFGRLGSRDTRHVVEVGKPDHDDVGRRTDGMG